MKEITLDSLIKKYEEKINKLRGANFKGNDNYFLIAEHELNAYKEMLQDLKVLEENCPHSKQYDDLIRPSNPPKRQWTCKICGEVGYDVIGKE